MYIQSSAPRYSVKKEAGHRIALLRAVTILLALFCQLVFVPRVGAATLTYTYDNLNRLTRADYGNGSYIQYTYDEVGNRTSMVSASGGVVVNPTVIIAGPTSNPTYSTEKDKVDLSGAASMRVVSVKWSNDRGGSGDCVGVSQWTATGISLQSGANVITVTAKDGAGNEGTDTITIAFQDSTPPTGSILINAGAESTDTVNSLLTVSATDAGSGVSQMRFSNDGTTWSAWEPYAISKPWTLTSGDGTKTVHAQFKDNAGNESQAVSDTISLGSGLTYVETVKVGDSGNVPDIKIMSEDGTTGYGSVSYVYNIGKYEVTTKQYTAFLNAKAKTDTYGLYHTSMWSSSYGCKIQRSGGGTAADPYVYTVADDWANRPVNFVSFWDACRFANWLNNGQGDGGTETGAYTLNGYNGSDGRTIHRNSEAKWFLSSEDEWYKAAYYKGGSNNAGYWLYPTKSDTAPSNVGSDGYTDPGNHANYLNGGDPRNNAYYTIGSPYYRTNVGEFEKSGSPYGTFDQGGNVYEWNEAVMKGTARGVRSGPFNGTILNVPASSRSWDYPMTEDTHSGIRVATLVTLSIVPPSDIISEATSRDGTPVNLGTPVVSGTPDPNPITTNDAPAVFSLGKTLVTWTATDKWIYVASGAQSVTVVDTTPPTGSIVINGGAESTNNPAVTLTLSATDAGSIVAQMRFSNDSTTWSDWEVYATSKAWTLTSGDGTKNVLAQYKDAVGNVSETCSDTIVLNTAPLTASIIINGGAEVTDSPSVTLTLSAGSGASQMCLSNDGQYWSTWEPYATTKLWDVVYQNGVQWVYVRYQDAQGNESPVYSDSIVLDTGFHCVKTYEIKDLGTLGGRTEAWGINDSNQIVGQSGGLGFISENFGQMRDIGVGGLGGGAIYDINNSGQVPGYWHGRPQAFIWENGVATLLLGSGFSRANGINDAGQVVGDSYLTGNRTATLWASDGSPSDLGAGPETMATDINNAGQVTINGSSRVRVWENGQIRDLGLYPGYPMSASYRLNDLGNVVGFCGVPNVVLRASVYLQNRFVLLGTLPGLSHSVANGVNNSLQVVGYSSNTYNGSALAYVWQKGQMQGLPFLTGGNYSVAYGINECGVIVGNSNSSSGVMHAVAWVPVDNTSPMGTISVNGGTEYSTSEEVTLALSAVDECGSMLLWMRFSNDNVTWTEREKYTTSKPWILTTGDGEKTVFVQYQDCNGNVSNFTDTIILDATGPVGSIVINSGAEYTNSPSVTLTLSATDAGSGVPQMRLSNDGATWSDWEVYATSKPWVVTANDGTKTVYAQFKDLAGNTSESCSDTIFLDTTGATGSVSVNGGAEFTRTTSVALSITASGSGARPARIRFSNNAAGWSEWEGFGTDKQWVLSTGDDTKTVYVQIEDLAGNISPNLSDTIILDMTTPTGSIVINGGAEQTASTNVTLTLSASDALSGVTQMQLSNDGSTWADLEPFATTKSWVLASGEGVKTVYARYVDGAGNISNSVSDQITLAGALIGTLVINDGAQYTSTTSVVLKLTATGSPTQMRFSNDGTSWSAWEAYSVSKAWTLTSGDGTKTVFAQFKDAVGNVSETCNDSILLDSGALEFINIETVPVGDPGNAGELSGAGAGGEGPDRICGSVGYTYNIGKYEVTAGQYTAFLNAVAATDTYGLYDTRMWSDLYGLGCKIQRTGASGSYSYSVSNDYANRPVNYVSYWDSCRFANWLENGQKTGAQDNSTTEDGTYTLTPGGITNNTITRNAGTTWAVTSEDEWYKAAYYKGGSTNAGYWMYPTRSNTLPSNVGSDGYIDPGNHANYGIKNLYTLGPPYYRTNVGEFENSASAYGTFDQGGNVWEWSEAISGASRGILGGSFGDDTNERPTRPIGYSLRASTQIYYGANLTGTTSGLRVSLLIDLSIVAPSDITVEATSRNGTPVALGTPVVSGTPDPNPVVTNNAPALFPLGNTVVTWTATDKWGYVASGVQNVTVIDTTPPTGSILINGGAESTNNLAVMLTLSAIDTGSGVAHMRLSNDGTAWSEWEPYATSKGWMLTSGDGTKTVYAQFKDAAGNVSETCNDSILLDSGVPPHSLIANAGPDQTLRSTGPGGAIVVLDGSGSSDPLGHVLRYEWDTDADGSFDDAVGVKVQVLLPVGDHLVALRVTDPFAFSATDTLSVRVVANSSVCYRIVDLGTLGGERSEAYDITDAGVVVGTASSLAVYYEPCMWVDGSPQSLSAGGCGFAQAINSNGVVVGIQNGGAGQAFLWNNGETTLIPGRDRAYDINDAGQIVGGLYQAFIWENGQSRNLGDLGYGDSTAFRINRAGQVVGRASSQGNYHAVLWQDGAIHDLGTLGGAKSFAYDINNLGYVVGYAYTAGSKCHAYSWIQGQITDLGTLDGYSHSQAIGVNDYNQVVGYSAEADPGSWPFRACLWQDGKIIDLGTLPGGSSSVGYAINNLGQIVGYSETDSGGTGGIHAVMWIPEPCADIPPLGTITINNGAELTNSVSVTLTLSATDDSGPVASMRFSNDGTAWSEWEPYATSKNWTLISGDGTKTVYAQFKDAAGNVSEPCNDSILLDSVTPPDVGFIDMETVKVGDPGNAADTRVMTTDGTTGHGSVGYTYNIGKYEVTAGQYTAFLNAVAATDTYALYNTRMSTSGITQSGDSGSYTYSVASDSINRPVSFVSYWDSCRFANWLGNGQPIGAQGNGTTETGAYTLDGYTGFDGRTIGRNAGATWAVTSEDEWYKAAYYRGGGTTAGYWLYPTNSNTAPGQDMADVSGNNANYFTAPYAYPIDSGKYATVVGEFQNSDSAYGTFDQGGNVWEWNEAIFYQDSDYDRGMRGGAFPNYDNISYPLKSSSRDGDSPSIESWTLGFRVSVLIDLYIVPPPDVKAEATSRDGTSVDLGTPVVSGTPDPNPVVTNNAPALFSLGNTVVAWTATDKWGYVASGVQNVTVVDTTPPSITAPPNITAQATGAGGTSVDLGTPTVTDLVDPNPTVTNDAPALFPIGPTVVTWTAKDASGNLATAKQNVTVVDTFTLTPPPDVQVTASGPNGTPVDLGTPTISGGCAPNPAVTNNAPALFPLGKTVVIWTAKDACGNTATAMQNVTVVKSKCITLTAPNGGETFDVGTAQFVTWTYGATGCNIGPYVRVELLNKSGVVCCDISDHALVGANGIGGIQWVVPTNLPYGDDYWIRIMSVRNPELNDASDDNFTVIAEPAFSMTLTAPNAPGTEWRRGVKQTITWKYTGTAHSTVRIDLLKNGSYVRNIAQNLSIGAGGLGKYDWTPTALAPGSDYKIRITLTTRQSIGDESDTPFKLL